MLIGHTHFSVLNTDGRVVDQARAWSHSLGIPYFRLSPLLSADVELDEKDDKVLVDMMWTAMAYICDKKDDVMRLKNLLCEWNRKWYVCVINAGTNAVDTFLCKTVFVKMQVQGNSKYALSLITFYTKNKDQKYHKGVNCVAPGLNKLGWRILECLEWA